MKIYTKKGDVGETSLFGGRRVSKASLRLNAYGTVDELNCYVGLVRDTQTMPQQLATLKEIQGRLFTIGSTLASDPDGLRERIQKMVPDLHDSDVELLENAIDEMTKALPLLRHFILPGGHVYVSYCHLARTVCRRAERLIVELNKETPVEPLIIKYLNRLSDYFFVLARKTAQDLNVSEVEWKSRSEK